MWVVSYFVIYSQLLYLSMYLYETFVLPDRYHHVGARAIVVIHKYFSD